MLDAIRSLFQREMDPTTGADRAAGHDPIHLATCALLLEIAHADEAYSDAERRHVAATMRREFGLDPAVIAEIEDVAARERERSIDLWQFTSLLAERYGPRERAQVVENVWRIVYADGEMTKHEHYLVRKIANLLDVDAAALYAAKVRVLEERQMDRPIDR